MVLSLSRAMSVVAKGLGGSLPFRRGRYYSTASLSPLRTFLANPNEFSDGPQPSKGLAQRSARAAEPGRMASALSPRRGAAQISAQCVSAGKENPHTHRALKGATQHLRLGAASGPTPLHTPNPTSPRAHPNRRGEPPCSPAAQPTTHPY